jgi:competence protein ComEC
MHRLDRKRLREWSLFAFVVGSLLFGVPALERLTAPGRLPVPSEVEAMSVSVFDVGQGDSILAQEGDKQILIDGGPNEATLERLGAIMPTGDRSIDLVILTHPHADHIDGLVKVLERYQVNRVLATDVVAPTAYFRKWQELLARNGVLIDDPQSVKTERVGDMEYDVLAAGRQAEVKRNEHDGNSDGLNDSSIVGMLKFGSRRFLMMGDATSTVEDRLIAAKTDVTADFLKIGHHGSNYSTSASFLSAVNPRFAATSVGAKNSYGNPAWRVTHLLDSAGVVNYRTDRNGTITAIVDGESLQVSAERVK